ncbi:MAG: KpsF/GutQ family sugar-phosphate isomerase [Prevotella sp.]|nr:KpsF/GutQ family sugar-phosphate isomerase [Prevotella sp.]
MKETLTDRNGNATGRLAHARMYAAQCLHDEAQAIEDLISQLDENFDRAVELIYHCRGKVIVTGVGKSGNVGSKIAATMSSTGTPAFFINPLDVYHGDLGVMTPDDIVLALSNSGQTDELLRFIPIVLHNHIPIISMTGNPESLLAKYSTAHILVSVKKEACPLNLAPTSSTTAALAMGDALAIALMEVRNFKPADFAQFHPGGELGKRLLTTAQDVMKTDELPVIPADMHLGEAIIHVSKGKLGLGVSLLDDKVEGIITDGDIRRAMERWQEQFFGKTVRDIMTTNPKCVTPHTKITEIQRIMNKYKVHSVLVIDQQRHLLGVVDHYRCML